MGVFAVGEGAQGEGEYQGEQVGKRFHAQDLKTIMGE